MNKMSAAAHKVLIGGICGGLLSLSACHKTTTPSAPPPEQKGPDAAAAGTGVKLSPEQIEKIGLKTEILESIDYAQQSTGYGSVIPHESIAAAVAELAGAQAAEKQSRSAVSRTQRLAGTAGALSADVAESNARQLAVDTAALNLAQQRLTATFGAKPPWSGGRSPELLKALAQGSTQLLRVTFPLGSLPGGVPKSLSVSRLGVGVGAGAGAGAGAGGEHLTMNVVWAAPADATVPGRSFFGLLRAGELGEGERVIASAPTGATQPGELVPASAALISNGKYWCYLETMSGTFERTEIDTGKPFENGYVVTSGLKAGDKVVTQGAAQLLAQESNTGQGED